VAAVVVAQAALTAACALAQPPKPRVAVSPYLVRVTQHAAMDVGEGVLEAEGVSSASEPRPAIGASHEARARAVDGLRAAVPELRWGDDGRLRDLPRDRLNRLDECARRSAIVAEWYAADGRVHAIAAVRLFDGESPLLRVALGVGPPVESDAPAEPLPAVILRVAGERVEPCLLPAIHGPDGAALFADAPACVARATRLVDYAPSEEEALTRLEQGQRAVVVDADKLPGSATGLRVSSVALDALHRASLRPMFEDVDRILIVTQPPPEG
jgi:hypothetical protein